MKGKILLLEDEMRLADLNLVPVFQYHAVGLRTVDKSAVRAAEIAENVVLSIETQLRMDA